jgi:hypothetical protein
MLDECPTKLARRRQPVLCVLGEDLIARLNYVTHNGLENMCPAVRAEHGSAVNNQRVREPGRDARSFRPSRVEAKPLGLLGLGRSCGKGFEVLVEPRLAELLPLAQRRGPDPTPNSLYPPEVVDQVSVE